MQVEQWLIRDEGYNKETMTHDGNKYFIGNGYLGVRGTLEEYGKEALVAVNLAGIYDQSGNQFREPLNAPNPFFTYLCVDDVIYKLPESEVTNHTICLNYNYGIFHRETTFITPRGQITIQSERYASMQDCHVLGMKYMVRSDFHAEVDMYTGIDGDIWEINGPHYDGMNLENEENCITWKAITHEKKAVVSVAEGIKASFPAERSVVKDGLKFLHKLSFVTEINRCYEVVKFASIYTSEDCNDCDHAARNCIKKHLDVGYEQALKLHNASWDGLWHQSQVIIEGDEEAMNALNYSIYHLHSIAPRHSQSMSIAARGLSGQTYKGAVFWDTEIFMLDFFLNTEPNVAKTLMRYRIDTLEGAKAKAKQYGYDGAFYAWESQEGGFDACSDYNVIDVFTKRPLRTYFKDKQIHISAAIVYGIVHYYEATGDLSILEDGGIETILECAKFYYSLLLQRVGKTKYELHDVIGPDEYHERVNNNGYTNRMAKFTFEQAVIAMKRLELVSFRCKQRIEKRYHIEVLQEQFQSAAVHLYLPEPNEDGVLEQFDGYFKLEDVSVQTVKSRLLNDKEYWGGAYGVASHTQVIKQADVISWLTLFPKDYQDDVILKNYEFYEPRTEHGSSLSASMYAMAACRCNKPDIAYPLFLKTANADLCGGGKEWAGLLYIGGTHPAAAGGAYMTAIKGFAGIYMEDGKIKAKPRLPKNWNKMKFKLCYCGDYYSITIKNNKAEISLIEG